MGFFDVTTVDGRRVRYQDLWQRRELLLLSLPAPPSAGWMDDLRARVGGAAEVVVTTESVAGVPRPGVLVADRWGEPQHIAAIDPGALDLDDLVDWVRFVRIQCPECQGEAR
jgi:hypothetical protein